MVSIASKYMTLAMLPGGLTLGPSTILTLFCYDNLIVNCFKVSGLHDFKFDCQVNFKYDPITIQLLILMTMYRNY